MGVEMAPLYQLYFGTSIKKYVDAPGILVHGAQKALSGL